MNKVPGMGRSCWVVTDGKIGMEIQGLGLAEALGFEPAVKRIQVRRPWRWLRPMWIPNPLATLGPKKDKLAPPWPDILIASGRQSVAISVAIRRASAGRCFTVQIQNPTVDLAQFDLIVAPRHDRLKAPNVYETIGAINRITPARLDGAAARFGPEWSDLPRPLIAVALGGNNKVYRLTPSIAGKFARKLAETARQTGAGILVTPSRRTQPEVLTAIREALKGLPARIWDGTGDNPYLGYLALADAIVVTADSVNMVSEAASTGKPVYVVELEGGSRKFRDFHGALRKAGITRPFEGRLETWSYDPLHDTEDAATEIHRRLAARHRPEAMAMSGEGTGGAN